MGFISISTVIRGSVTRWTVRAWMSKRAARVFQRGACRRRQRADRVQRGERLAACRRRTSTLEPLYVEVWSPNDTFRDLREIICGRAICAADARRAAAYLRDFQSADPAVQRGAMNALRRLTAAIYLNGGSHIVLGERDGVLCAPYFPDYARLRPAWARAVRADYDFIARYSECFFDPTWRDISATSTGGINEEVRLDMPRYGPNAELNSVWTIVRAKEHTLTLGLVNLRGMEAPLWNAPQPAARRIRALRVTLQLEKPIKQSTLRLQITTTVAQCHCRFSPLGG